MTNEWAEFRAYTTQPVYACASKRDHSYLSRFTLGMIQEPVGLARILTILARGYLFHDADGALLAGSPYDRADFARRALCAWCSVPENKKSSDPPVDFRALSTEFPELVDDKGRGWYYRHVKAVIAFVRAHPEETDQWTQKKIDPISKGFTNDWKKKVRQMQVPVFHYKTKGAWIHRFDDMIADALEAGPLRTEEYPLTDEYVKRIDEVISDDKLKPVAPEVVRFYLANRSDDTPWVVLPVQSFDAFYGSTAFSKKQLVALPKELIVREYRDGVCRIRLADEMISAT